MPLTPGGSNDFLARLFPDFAIDIWLGALAPAGTPRPIINRLNTELDHIIRDPQIMKDRLNPIGLESRHHA